MATESTFSPDERQSGKFTATLEDQDGAAVLLSAISSITLTLFDLATGAIINGRSAQDVKNTNQCTFDATSGLFTWLWLPEDQVILNDDKAIEHHIAQFVVKWNSSARQTDYRIIFAVRNLSKVP